jgi:hypothetical protein
MIGVMINRESDPETPAASANGNGRKDLSKSLRFHRRLTLIHTHMPYFQWPEVDFVFLRLADPKASEEINASKPFGGKAR